MNAKEQLEAFKAEERVEGFYEGLTLEEQLQRNTQYTQLKIAVDIEAEKIKAFNVEKQKAYAVLAAKHDSERIALGKVWAEKEANL